MSLLAARRGALAARTAAAAEPDPEFSPDDVADLQLWFDADALTGLADTDPVTQWDDESGNGRHISQATASTKPTYRTNVLNGLPAVRFDGGDNLQRSDAGIAFSQPNTMLAVIRRTGTTERQFFTDSHLDGPTSGREVAYLLNSGNVGIWSGSFLNGSAGTTNAVLFRALYNGGSSLVHIGGTQVASGNAGSNSLSGGFTVGSSRSGSDFLEGDVHELLFYSRQLTSGEIGQIEDYLADKWGLTI